MCYRAGAVPGGWPGPWTAWLDGSPSELPGCAWRLEPRASCVHCRSRSCFCFVTLPRSRSCSCSVALSVPSRMVAWRPPPFLHLLCKGMRLRELFVPSRPLESLVAGPLGSCLPGLLCRRRSAGLGTACPGDSGWVGVQGAAAGDAATLPHPTREETAEPPGVARCSSCALALGPGTTGFARAASLFTQKRFPTTQVVSLRVQLRRGGKIRERK